MVGGWADGTRTPRGRYVRGTEIVDVNRKHREQVAEIERLTAALAAERALADGAYHALTRHAYPLTKLQQEWMARYRAARQEDDHA